MNGKESDNTTPSIPEKTEVKDPKNLTKEEKEKVKEAIEKANKDKFPEGTKVEVGADGTATITYPDGSKDTIKGSDLVEEKTPTTADKTEPVVPAKTEVVDKTNLTDTEKAAVKKAIEDANKDKFPEGTKVEVGADGTATITYPDGSKDTIKGSDLVEEKTPTTADKTEPVVPAKTEVVDKTNLTDTEKAAVKKAIEDANKDKFPEGTKVEVGNDGTVTITYPDKSTKTIKGSDVIVGKTDKNAPTHNGKDGQDSPSRKPNNPTKLPKAGIESEAMMMAAAALSTLGGLYVSRKKKEDEE